MAIGEISGGAMLGVAGDAASAWYSNRLAERRQHEAQSYNEGMYGKRYQMQVADLKAAGLNPMLAYGNAAPLAPGSIPAPVTNPKIGESINASKIASAQEDAMRAQAEKTRKETSLIDTQKANMEADTINKIAEKYLIEAKTWTEGLTAAQRQAETKRIESEIQKVAKEIKLIDSQIEINKTSVILNETRNRLTEQEIKLAIEKTYLTGTERERNILENEILRPKAWAAGLGSAYGAARAQTYGDTGAAIWKIILPSLGFTKP